MIHLKNWIIENERIHLNDNSLGQVQLFRNHKIVNMASYKYNVGGNWFYVTGYRNIKTVNHIK